MTARGRTGDAGAISEAEFEDAFSKIPQSMPIHRDVDRRFQAIAKALQNEADNWSVTCNALIELRSIVKYGGLDGKTIAQKLNNIQDEIRQSVISLRSQVARDACITVAYVAQHIGMDFKNQAESLVPDLLKMSGQSTKIMATSGVTALRYICKNIKNHAMLQMLFEELKNNKSKLIRSTICLLLLNVVEEWPEELLQKNAQLLYQALEKGSTDADATARKYSRDGLQKAEAKVTGFSAMCTSRAIPASRGRTAQSTYIPMRAKSDMTSHQIRKPFSAPTNRIPLSQRKPSNPSLASATNFPPKSQPGSRNASPKRRQPPTSIQPSTSSSAIRSRVLNERRMNGATGPAAVPPKPTNGDLKGRPPVRQISEPKIHQVRNMRSPSPTTNGHDIGRRTPSNLRQPSAIVTPKVHTPVYRPQARVNSHMAEQNGSQDVQTLLNNTQIWHDGSPSSTRTVRESLDQLTRMVNDHKISQLDYYLPQLFNRSIEIATDTDAEGIVRCSSVRLLKALVKNGKGITSRINTLINEIVNLEENEVPLHKEIEDLYVEISNSCPVNAVLPILLNLVRATKTSDPTNKVRATLQLLPYVLHKTDTIMVEGLVDDIVPVLRQIYENSTVTGVRRDAVICMIVFKNKVGIERIQQKLNANLVKLVEAYATRRHLAIWN
ncbi:unnamed protein product [Bursaphelenchus okinawaensis]|uniref:TOG domain-containing protein n=1 Tax=Bursaphelenchus okinawaensis TaxID=465554 RepID=A0A811KN13_9BILA|nr:unnamed protein product [Bursaphelenchus okinawaensis]CAG9106411.1 unnamed protein product [Bursaphelenchus okinawaensis]